jgi:hypothetical protein
LVEIHLLFRIIPLIQWSVMFCRPFIVLVSHAICYSLNAIWSYITELVCYTYFHCFFNTECQHIFGKQTGYIFQSPKQLKHGRQNQHVNKTLVWPHDVKSVQGSTFCLFVMVQPWNIGVCWIDQVFVTELNCFASLLFCYVIY